MARAGDTSLLSRLLSDAVHPSKQAAGQLVALTSSTATGNGDVAPPVPELSGHLNPPTGWAMATIGDCQARWTSRVLMTLPAASRGLCCGGGLSNFQLNCYEKSPLPI